MSPLPYNTGKQVAQTATTVTRDRQYHSTLSGKSAFLSEVKTVLRAMDAGQGVDQIREAVLEEDLLDRRTWHRRSTVWKEVFRRYISGRAPENVATLARMVTHCPNPIAVNLALFYEYCQVDGLLYDLTACCTYDLYHSARTAIDQVDVNEWLSGQEASSIWEAMTLT
jgi:hypothetical protein